MFPPSNVAREHYFPSEKRLDYSYGTPIIIWFIFNSFTLFTWQFYSNTLFNFPAAFILQLGLNAFPSRFLFQKKFGSFKILVYINLA